MDLVHNGIVTRSSKGLTNNGADAQWDFTSMQRTVTQQTDPSEVSVTQSSKGLTNNGADTRDLTSIQRDCEWHNRLTPVRWRCLPKAMTKRQRKVPVRTRQGKYYKTKVRKRSGQEETLKQGHHQSHTCALFQSHCLEELFSVCTCRFFWMLREHFDLNWIKFNFMYWDLHSTKLMEWVWGRGKHGGCCSRCIENAGTTSCF